MKMKINSIKLLLITICLISSLNVFAYRFVFEVDGIYYIYGNQEGTCLVTKGDEPYSGTVSIPNSVTTADGSFTVTGIEHDAFSRCRYLTSVTIPNSVTSIGNSAFANCPYLTSVTIPNSVTSIGNSAFEDCGLLSVTIPNSVTSIGGSAFYRCGSLSNVTIEEGDFPLELGYDDVDQIHVFTATSVQNVYLGRNLKGNKPDFGSSLVNVTISNNVDSIISSCFEDCYGLTSVTIPNSVTSIGNSAFAGCHGLTSVTIPNSVTSIGNSAFEESGLLSVTIPNFITNIGNSAFYDCYRLKSVTIGTGVESIGKGAFARCENLYKMILLPNSVPTGFGDIFEDDNSYRKTSVKITYVANNTFNGYYRDLGTIKIYPFLSSKFETNGVWYVPVSPTERTCDVFDCTYSYDIKNLNIEKEVQYKTLKMQVKNINDYSFADNNSIVNLNVENDGFIGDYAFSGCDYISNVNINGTQSYIGYSAFASCPNMIKAALTGIVTTLEDYSFEGCKSLVDLSLPNTVVTMGNSVFRDCSSLKNFTFPTSLLSLGYSAFRGCSSLESVTLNKKIKTIDDATFFGCKSLATISIPDNVNKIGNGVFKGCTGLKKFIVEDGNDSLSVGINSEALSNVCYPLFSDCPLDSVYLGSHISYETSKDYGYSPFYINTSLRAIKIGDHVGEVYDNEFYGCTGLTSVSIGEGVKKIGKRAFSLCSRLDNFVFGKNVESIGEEAFSDCTSMTRLVSHCTVPPTCGTQALDDINKMECTLYVPKGYLSAYQTADQWKEFFFMEEGDPTSGIASPSVNDDNVKEKARYTTDGHRIYVPAKGLNIIKMSDGTVRKIMVK